MIKTVLPRYGRKGLDSSSSEINNVFPSFCEYTRHGASWACFLPRNWCYFCLKWWCCAFRSHWESEHFCECEFKNKFPAFFFEQLKVPRLQAEKASNNVFKHDEMQTFLWFYIKSYQDLDLNYIQFQNTKWYFVQLSSTCSSSLEEIQVSFKIIFN